MHTKKQMMDIKGITEQKVEKLVAAANKVAEFTFIVSHTARLFQEQQARNTGACSHRGCIVVHSLISRARRWQRSECTR